MRTLALGDIHGCHTALTTLQAYAGFAPDDLILTLGDVVDKGPQVPQVLNWLIDRQAAGQLVALRGNHDVLMLEARGSQHRFDVWLTCGGRETLEGYNLPLKQKSLGEIPDAHWAFLQATVLFHETDTHFFVHGNVDPDLPLSEQPEHVLLWEKFHTPPLHPVPEPHLSGKTMVCGHTSQKSGHINDQGHAVCIDTWACGNGWLTALDPYSGEYWQANQSGKTRRGRR